MLAKIKAYLFDDKRPECVLSPTSTIVALRKTRHIAKAMHVTVTEAEILLLLYLKPHGTTQALLRKEMDHISGSALCRKLHNLTNDGYVLKKVTDAGVTIYQLDLKTVSSIDRAYNTSQSR